MAVTIKLPPRLSSWLAAWLWVRPQFVQLIAQIEPGLYSIPNLKAFREALEAESPDASEAKHIMEWIAINGIEVNAVQGIRQT